jgi:hypothetical protein
MHLQKHLTRRNFLEHIVSLFLRVFKSENFYVFIRFVLVGT